MKFLLFGSSGNLLYADYLAFFLLNAPFLMKTGSFVAFEKCCIYATRGGVKQKIKR